MKYEILSTSEFKTRYRRLKKHIAPAISRGDYNMATVLHRIYTHKILPVVMHHAGQAVGVMLLEKADGELHILSIGGDFPRGWMQKTLYFLKELARAHNCNRIQLQGRRGWIRVLTPLGFRRDGELMVYDMEPIT
jgi:hypothetical protein